MGGACGRMGGEEETGSLKPEPKGKPSKKVCSNCIKLSKLVSLRPQGDWGTYSNHTFQKKKNPPKKKKTRQRQVLWDKLDNNFSFIHVFVCCF